jgi:hypothetical protein
VDDLTKAAERIEGAFWAGFAPEAWFAPELSCAE